MMGELKAGDVVQLKSGGPLMTIQELKHGGGAASCIWFLDGKPEAREFALVTLELHVS
jgi:uncharacterized protein YodC (DUF2158 family)